MKIEFWPIEWAGPPFSAYLPTVPHPHPHQVLGYHRLESHRAEKFGDLPGVPMLGGGGWGWAM